ncbi:dienelactone hydrolase family protein [Ponticaulis profundi]|uniref:Dienelactone hydrolase family protein n=1 Tax=Ponticaulis profundi TaxID=2665222 RepID=A0ABW1S6A6_9PROT
MLKRFLAASSMVSALALAGPAMAGTSVTYELDGMAFEGYLAESTLEPKGLVIVIHDWDGLDSYEMTRAEMLADKGYDAFAVDLYGKGNRPESIEARKEETGKLYSDRETMRARILAGLKAAQAETGLTRSVVMGYCFGGGATLELARSGEGQDVVGYATFHGTLATPEGQNYSEATAPILISHGGADSGIPLSDTTDLAGLLEEAGVPYELEVYSGAPHAFTVFGSDRYRKLADEKSWSSFLTFIDRYLAQPE